jgi:hypothetical protein
MAENRYQAKVIKKLKTLFPGAIVLKNDANYMQGIPDILVLFGFRWAVLECKDSSTSPERPNQAYYIAKCNEMSFGAFIYPENEMEVLHGLQLAFGDCW